MKILIETSARHMHISSRDFEKLFGVNSELSVKSGLSQPGEFVSDKRVTIVGPRNSIENVVILGPFREKSQVEVSITDAIRLGIKPLIRKSGDILNSPGCKVCSSNGDLQLNEGLIVAKRHIHMALEDAAKCGIANHDIVKVLVNGFERKLIFDDVIVRVDRKFSTAMHIDTDEANSAGIFGTAYGEILT